MKVLVQRSKYSEVLIDNKVVGKINSGLVLLVGFTHTDSEKEIDKMINKVLNLRIFDDENGIMNKSILDNGGEILSVSQFTLYADTKKGNRPSYINSMKKEEASKMYALFNDKLKKHLHVETGVFHENMLVKISNDGPTTIILEV